MQKQQINLPPPKQNAKKKKNKGWDQSNLPSSHSPPPSQAQNQPQQLINPIQKDTIQQQFVLSQRNGVKKLSEMAGLYHVEMSLEIGSGFASIVYLGECIATQKAVCVKVIDLHVLGGAKQKKALEREIKYLRELDSKHIVRLLDSFQSPSFCYIVMEYCGGGDLYRFMRQSPPLHPLFVREIIEQITYGLLQLKQKKLLHRDFKTENILLGANFQAKIGDLGFCISIDDEEVIHNVGSPIYMSPQVLNGGCHSYSSDIYGLGIIWYELLHGKAPWQALTEKQLLHKKTQIPLQQFREDISQSDRQLIKRCLSVNPQQRCKAEQILSYCQQTNKPQKQKLLDLRGLEQGDREMKVEE